MQNNAAVMPHTNLQMILNYLKSGHAVLPSQPMQPMQGPTPVMGQPSAASHFPASAPITTAS